MFTYVSLDSSVIGYPYMRCAKEIGMKIKGGKQKWVSSLAIIITMKIFVCQKKPLESYLWIILKKASEENDSKI